MTAIYQQNQSTDPVSPCKDYRANVDRIIGRSISCDVAISKGVNLLAFAADIYLHVPRFPTAASPRKIPLSSTSSPSHLPHKDSSLLTGSEDPANLRKGRFRAKSLASIAISPDGKWLACGEQGQAPRICIWNLKNDASISDPRHIIKAHSYGVKHLSFSPNSQYLASIGYIHDGGIHVWDILNGPTKVATNRVTARLQNLLWVDNMLVTIGTRHIRVWQWAYSELSRAIRPKTVDEVPRVLQGRNLVLGNHVHSEFLAACAIDEARFFCATSHSICIADVVEKRPILEILSVDYEISCLTLDAGHLVVGDTAGKTHHYEFIKASKDVVLTGQESAGCCMLKAVSTAQHFDIGIETWQTVTSGESVVTTSDGSLYISRANSSEFLAIATASAALACRQHDADQVIIASDSGELSFSTYDRPLCSQRLVSNFELSTSFFLGSNQILYGTKQGEISLVSTRDGLVSCSVRGHEGEVTKIISNSNETLLISLGRDRMVQLYGLDLDKEPGSQLYVIQTFDEHSANITGALFITDHTLLSCSADRTIVVRVRNGAIHEAQMSYDVHKIIDLKSAATALAKISERQVLVSCLDKSLLLLDISSGEMRELCKTDDVYDHIAVDHAMVVCCCASSQDRSICLRSLRTGQLVSTKGFCHVENITSLQWSLEREDSVWTTGLDGLVVSWWFEAIETTLLSTPVRKIKSKAPDLNYTELPRSPQLSGIRRNSSLTRLGRSTVRALSPSKLRDDSCEPSPLQTSSTKAAVLMDDTVDTDTLVKSTITRLQRLRNTRKNLSEQQLAALQSATLWLTEQEDH